MLRILFTGYAPVHFVCFLPLLDRLRAAGIQVFLSGGLRSGTLPDLRHDARALFEPFGARAKNILSVEEIRDRDFDVVFAANTQIIMPRNVGAKVQIFHGVSFRSRAIREENSRCDFYFLIGPYMQRKFAEAHLLSADDPRAVKIGFMKTDRMLNGELSRDELL